MKILMRKNHLLALITFLSSIALAKEPSFTTNSIFNLASEWTSQAESKMRLSHFKDKKSVFAMVYTSCQYTCPLITSKLQEIERKLKTPIHFVLVSFDPDRDTPQKLKKYAEKMKLSDQWTLLHGKEKDIRELAAVLGVNYKKDAQGEFSHSNVISYIDSSGEIKFQMPSLNEDLDEFIKKIK